MSTTVSAAGIAASSAAISASASSDAANAAREARKAACKVSMPGFKDADATVEAKVEYAECVQLLHPREVELTTDMILILQIAFSLLVTAGVLGFIFEKGLHDRIMGLFMYPLVTAAVMAVAALAGWFGYWLFWLV